MYQLNGGSGFQPRSALSEKSDSRLEAAPTIHNRLKVIAMESIGIITKSGTLFLSGVLQACAGVTA